jgi:hypothetical protein
MKIIVATFALTVTALAVASVSYVCNHGVPTDPAHVTAGVFPPPCGLPGLPPCPQKSSKKLKNAPHSWLAAK